MDLNLDFDDEVFVEAVNDDSNIAIIGLDGRFGNTTNLLEFWQSLESKKDFIVDVPLTRWNKDDCDVEQGGFIPDDVVFNFDYNFFGISPVEATAMDPQQRLLLEVSMGAFDHAGFTKDSLMNQQIGVYVGICGNDFAQTIKETTIYGTTGTTHSIAANRISYVFGLTGPSMAIDTACSSSLVAMHLASNALRNNECETALVAGVNILINHQWTNVFHEMKMLANDYRCKTFSAEANGYVRGEGCGAVVVQIESTAVNQGNAIYGIVCGTAVNQDGKTATLTAPSGTAQEKCIKAALDNAAIGPNDVKYVECHGTGTPLGDPIEVESIMNQYGNRSSPLIIGALKSNLGHLEGAAGIAGLIKVVLALHHRRVPPNLHHTVTNSHIIEVLEEHSCKVQFPSNSIELETNNTLYAGVSSFGFGGTNSHIILKSTNEKPTDFSKPSIQWDHKSMQPPMDHWHIKYHNRSLLQQTNENNPLNTIWDGVDVEQLKTFIKQGKKIWYISKHSFKLNGDLQGKQHHDDSQGKQHHHDSQGKQHHHDSQGKQHHDDSQGKQHHDDSCNELNAKHDEKLINDHQINIGLMQVLFLEHRDSFGGIIDVDTAIDDYTDIIEAEIQSNCNEYITVYRNHTRHVARFEPIHTTSACEVPIDATKMYIITGGTGYLGQTIAKKLITRGAKYIQLWSRSSTCNIDWAGDASITIHHVDLQDKASIQSALSNVSMDIGMVFHASGIYRECSLMDVTKSIIDDHIAAKNPTVLLETLPANIVKIYMFSSISAQWGTVGAAMYGASNRLLEIANNDSRCQIIYYGPFANGGMAKDKDFTKIGLKSLDTTDLWRSFELPTKNPIVCSMDVEQFTKLLSTGPSFSLFNNVINDITSSTSTPTLQNSFLIELFQSNPENREVILKTLIDSLIEQQGIEMKMMDAWMDCGFDSLTVVDFRNTLQTHLASVVHLTETTLFDYPTPQKLINHIMDSIFPSMTTNTVVYKDRQVEPISIIGVACRFPNGSNLEEFWASLLDKKNSVMTIPSQRFDSSNEDIYVNKGAFITDLDYFDYGFFGISKLEVTNMDPQQYLLLETCYEALHQASYTKDSLKDTNIGVYVGIGNHDHLANMQQDAINSYTATGQAFSIAANRISYTLGLKGPSLAIDTACSSSLVALDVACKALYNGDCDVALVASVNLLLSPLMYMATCGAKMLSVDGRCATFSNDANGYVRGEGCGAVVVKPQSNAQRDNDASWAIIRATATNQDGHTANLTSPNGPSQESVLQKALDRAGLDATNIDYIEAHGTGTALGDPIEIQSISNVYGQREKPLYIGAVKTNIGHLEPAAGMAGLIKTILVMRHRCVPANLNFKSLNPRLGESVKKSNIVFPTNTIDLNCDKMYAGISSFGFGGTNGHVILESTETFSNIANVEWNKSKLGNKKSQKDKLDIPIERISNHEWTQTWTEPLRDYIACHRVGMTSLVPATCYMEILMPCIKDLFGEQENFILKDLKFKQMLFLQNKPPPTLKIQYIDSNDTKTFKIFSKDPDTDLPIEHASITLDLDDKSIDQNRKLNIDEIKDRCIDSINHDEFYEEIGNDYKGDFATVEKVLFNHRECLTYVDLSTSTAPGNLQSCGWVDACLHGSIAMFKHYGLAFFAKRTELYWVSSTKRPAYNKLYAHSIRDDMYDKVTTYIFDDSVDHKMIAIVKNVEIGISASFDVKTPVYQWVWKDTPLLTTTDGSNDGSAVTIINVDQQDVTSALSLIQEAIHLHTRIIIHSTDNQQGWVGLVHTLNQEYMQIQFQFAMGTDKEIINESQHDTDDEIVAYINGTRKVYRYEHLSKRTLQHFPHHSYNVPERGTLQSLQKEEALPLIYIGDNQVEVEILSVGLNFRDVLNVLGMYPGDPGPPGGDMCGIVKRAGKDVKHVQVNDIVMGFTFGSLAQYNTTNADLVVKAPTHLSYAEASSLPIVTLTVEMAFYELYTITKDDVVLIHAGAGGVGLTAIQYAQQVGATIIVTAGAEFKHDYLRSIGVTEIYPSRDAEAFMTQTQHWKGKVTLVLNSLADKYIDYSVDLLCQGGKFMEIGKRAIWTHDEMTQYRSDVEYHAIAVDTQLVEEPKRIQSMLQRVTQRYHHYKPLPCTEFTDTIKALQYLQQAKHIGKVCWLNDTLGSVSYSNGITVPNSVIITGGNGGLGRLFSNFIVEKYPSMVVYSLSRSGVKDNKNHHPRIINVQCDVSERSQLEKAIKDASTETTIVGVIHAAGVLKDSMFSNINIDDFNIVRNVKVNSAYYLDELTRSMNLKFFLLCSSMSAALGSLGQSSYAMANSALDALAEKRHQNGLVATSIQWGAWDLDGNGMASSETLKRCVDNNYGVITKSLGLQTLQTVMEGKDLPPVMLLTPLSGDSTSTQKETTDITGTSTDASMAAFLQLPHDTQLTTVKTFITETVLNVAGVEVTEDDALMEAGLDSLSSVELINALQKHYVVALDSTIIFSYPSVQKLSDKLHTEILAMHSTGPIVLENYTISSMTTDDWSTVKYFTVQYKDNSEIVFLSPIDCSSMCVGKDVEFIDNAWKFNKKIKGNKLITMYNCIPKEQVNSQLITVIKTKMSKEGDTFVELDKTGTLKYINHK